MFGKINQDQKFEFFCNYLDIQTDVSKIRISKSSIKSGYLQIQSTPEFVYNYRDIQTEL